MTEDQIQIQFMQWLETFHFDHYRYTYHIPNGGNRKLAEAFKLKRMGVKRGVADLYFMHLKLYMEIKSEKGRLSPEQLQFKEQVEISGQDWCVAYGFEDCVKKFKLYARIT